jgi:hypothetical protein
MNWNLIIWPSGKVKRKVKSKVHPLTGHEDPEGGRGIALLFL